MAPNHENVSSVVTVVARGKYKEGKTGDMMTNVEDLEKGRGKPTTKVNRRTYPLRQKV